MNTISHKNMNENRHTVIMSLLGHPSINLLRTITKIL